LFDVEFTIVGSIETPLYFASYPDYSYIPIPDTNDFYEVEGIFYFNNSSLPLPTTKMWLHYKNDSTYFNRDYYNLIEKKARFFNELSNGENTDPGFLFAVPLNLSTSHIIVRHITEQISVISLIFPLFFFLVTALVVLNTMTRLIEEERLSIGCCETLGVNVNKIRMKYISISVISGIIGSLIGIFGLGWILPRLIHQIFIQMFSFPVMAEGIVYTFGIIMAGILILIMGLVSLFVVNQTLKEKPAYLLKHRSPKNGKITLIEKTFIWKHLAFRFKSSIRNIFRHKKVLIMTLISTAGSTALILAGLGLLNTMSPDNFKGSASDISSSIRSIAVFLIVIAGLMCAFVLFNLSNMNIDERKRELATLKVLGYKESEVSMYVFREIFILNFFGSILGLPVGVGLIYIVMAFMDADLIGVHTRIDWYSYFLTIILVMLFTALSSLILLPKIRKLDMLAALKTIE